MSRGPLDYLSLIENPTIQTPSHRVHAHSNFDITFNLHRKKQRIKLSLEPSHGIVAEGAQVNYLDAAGNIVRTEAIDRNEHKIFKGDTWVEEQDGSWSNIGWARVTVRRDGFDPLFEGTFTVAHDSHHIMLRSNYMQTRHELDPYLEASEDEFMVVFRDSDVQKEGQHTELRLRGQKELRCSADSLGFNMDPNHPVYTTMLKRDIGYWGSSSLATLFGKRQIDTVPTGGNSGSVNLKLSIGSTNGCPNTRKVALIGVATDCSYTASFNSSESARQNVIHQINSASAVYEKTFNITIGLQNLTIVDGNCPGTAPPATPWNIGCGNTSITDRLNTFSQWRGQRNDNNAYWTLLTNCATGAEVGLAWLGQLCVSNVIAGSGESVSGANVVARTSTEWQVIAHESGHTFGAVHDCNSQTCSDGSSENAQLCCPLSTSTCDAGSQFIMNPSTGNDISQFSACTVGNICSALLRNSVNSSCLSDNKGVTTLASEQSCGNGIVEGNEQCDCGGVAGCGNNPWCDGATCKFKNNAVCDPANDECCNSGQFAANGTVCRASTGSCNPQEVCSGTAATCPPDKVAPNGQDCGNGLTCASGQCTSRDQQCKTLMGSFTTNNDTYACNHQDCTLSCASPQFGPGQCYSMQQNFLDGTACGGGGTCSNVNHHFLFPSVY